jgi:hypothetical protein
MYQTPPPDEPQHNPHATRDLLIWLAMIAITALLLLYNYWG